MSNAKFRSDIAKFINKANKANDTFVRKLVLEIYSRVVLRSPVDSGRFRANWQVGNGSIDYTVTNNTDVSGASAISKAALELSSMNINGQTIFVSNSLSYSQRLEFDGWSKQAPAGMIRVTLAELSSITSKVAFEVKNNYQGT